MLKPPLADHVMTAAPQLPNLHLITFGDMNAHEVLMNYIDKVLERISQLINQNVPFVIVLPLNGAALIAMDLLQKADPTTAPIIRRSMRFVSKASPGLGDSIPVGTTVLMLDEIIDKGDTVTLFLNNTSLEPSSLEVHTITSKLHTNAIISDLAMRGVACNSEVCFPDIDGKAQWITCGAGLDQASYPEEMDAVAIGLLERFCTQFYGRLPKASIDDWAVYIELLKTNLRSEYRDALVALIERGLSNLPITLEGEIIRYLYLMDSTTDFEERVRYMQACLDLRVSIGIEA